MTPVTYIRERLDVGPSVKARLLDLLHHAAITLPHEYVMRDGRRVCSACELSEAEAQVGDGSAVPCLGRPAR